LIRPLLQMAELFPWLQPSFDMSILGLKLCLEPHFREAPVSQNQVLRCDGARRGAQGVRAMIVATGAGGGHARPETQAHGVRKTGTDAAKQACAKESCESGGAGRRRAHAASSSGRVQFSASAASLKNTVSWPLRAGSSSRMVTSARRGAPNWTLSSNSALPCSPTTASSVRIIVSSRGYAMVLGSRRGSLPIIVLYPGAMRGRIHEAPAVTEQCRPRTRRAEVLQRRSSFAGNGSGPFVCVRCDVYL
jgi:hypothetical protein